MNQIRFSDYENIIEPVHTVVAVGDTTTTVLPENPHRRYAILINDSDEKMYIKLGFPAVQAEGIPVAAGGSLEISPAKANFYKGQINAICATGGKSLLVTEG